MSDTEGEMPNGEIGDYSSAFHFIIVFQIVRYLLLLQS